MTPPVESIDVFIVNDPESLVVEIGGGSGSSGNYLVEQHLLDAGDIAAKSVTLSAAPTIANFVLLQVDGGAPAFYGLDFTVAGNTLSWNSLRLDGLLAVSDRIQVIYY
jgi:hypothetical protein